MTKVSTVYCPLCGDPKCASATVCAACYRLARKAGINSTGDLQAWVRAKRSVPSDDEVQDRFEDVNAMAVEIADIHAVSAVEGVSQPQVMEGGALWYDPSNCANYCALELRYCEARNLLRHHPTRTNLVRPQQ
jgi:hypothetical protein